MYNPNYPPKVFGPVHEMADLSIVDENNEFIKLSVSEVFIVPWKQTKYIWLLWYIVQILKSNYGIWDTDRGTSSKTL